MCGRTQAYLSSTFSATFDDANMDGDASISLALRQILFTYDLAWNNRWNGDAQKFVSQEWCAFSSDVTAGIWIWNI